MPRGTTIAALSGLAAGITLTVAIADGITLPQTPGLVLAVAAEFAPVAIATTIALVAFRRWITAHGKLIRDEAEALAEHRQQIAEEVAERSRQFGEEFERRSAELRYREEAIARQVAAMEEQRDLFHAQLAEARAGRAEAVRERDKLQADFDVLADEYNASVLNVMDDRAAAFTRSRRGSSALDGRAARRERVKAAAPRVVRIGQQPQPEPDHHARPAEI